MYRVEEWFLCQGLPVNLGLGLHSDSGEALGEVGVTVHKSVKVYLNLKDMSESVI